MTDHLTTRISKAIEDFDNGTLAKADVIEIVRRTVNEAFDTGFTSGLSESDKDWDEDDEIAFEAELDLNENTDDEEDDVV